MSTRAVRFQGSENFRSRLVLSVLSGVPVVFENVRPMDVVDGSGLRDYEVSFLRLVDRLTNGSKVRINETGTTVRFVPGIAIGGEFEHTCPPSRPIGYFIEWILPLAVLCKQRTRIVFSGVTNSDSDLSVDSLQSVSVPLMRRVAAATVGVKLVKRGALPGGGGQIIFTSENVKHIPCLDLVDAGLVKRVRGVAYATRVAPSYCNRLVDSAREVLNRFTADVYIYTDHTPKRSGGESPGFGLSLVAETTTHCLLVGDASSTEDVRDPSAIAVDAVNRLLEEIDHGGCVDTSHQSLALLFMALSQEDVSRIRLGRLSKFTVQFLRDVKSFLGTTFQVAPDRDANSIVLSCIGTGYSNIARPTK